MLWFPVSGRFTSRAYSALRAMLVGIWQASPAKYPPTHQKNPLAGQFEGEKRF